MLFRKRRCSVESALKSAPWLTFNMFIKIILSKWKPYISKVTNAIPVEIPPSVGSTAPDFSLVTLN